MSPFEYMASALSGSSAVYGCYCVKTGDVKTGDSARIYSFLGSPLKAECAILSVIKNPNKKTLSPLAANEKKALQFSSSIIANV
ncbi:MAG: hypothetical protein ACUZ8O_13890 [Candidatus Anammoxibacter sp.]